MAKMNGCNTGYHTMSKPQGNGRMNPSAFNRKNMSMGGVNDYLGGSKRDEKSRSMDDKARSRPGAAGGSKYGDMPKGK